MTNILHPPGIILIPSDLGESWYLQDVLGGYPLPVALYHVLECGPLVYRRYLTRRGGGLVVLDQGAQLVQPLLHLMKFPTKKALKSPQTRPLWCAL